MFEPLALAANRQHVSNPLSWPCRGYPIEGQVECADLQYRARGFGVSESKHFGTLAGCPKNDLSRKTVCVLTPNIPGGCIRGGSLTGPWLQLPLNGPKSLKVAFPCSSGLRSNAFVDGSKALVTNHKATSSHFSRNVPLIQP
jgi:hypothetical protein